MSYVSISSAIATLLNTVTELNQVTEYEPKEVKKYPAAAITPLGHDNAPYDIAANRRVFSFIVRLYYRIDDGVGTTYEGVMRDLVDKVLNKLESSVTLNGSCDFSLATKAKWLFQEREVPVRVVEISIDAVKRVNR